MALSSNILAQQCTIPIAINCEDNIYTNSTEEGKLEVLFSSYLKTKGFIRDGNSRLQFRLVPAFQSSNRSGNENVMVFVNLVLEEVATKQVLCAANIDTFVYAYLPTWQRPGSGSSDWSTPYYTALSDYGNCYSNKITLVERFVETAKSMIVSLYDIRLPKLLENARIYSDKGYQDEILFYCSQVPTCCKRYPDVQACALVVFLSYVKSHPVETLKDAENVWKSQNC